MWPLCIHSGYVRRFDGLSLIGEAWECLGTRRERGKEGGRFGQTNFSGVSTDLSTTETLETRNKKKKYEENENGNTMNGS